MDVDFREEMNARLNEEQARVELMIAEHKAETRDIQRELSAKMDLLLQTVSAKLDQQTAMLVRWVAGTMIGGFAVMAAVMINMMHQSDLRIDDIRQQVEQSQRQMEQSQRQTDARIEDFRRQAEQWHRGDEARRIEQLEERVNRLGGPRPRSGQAE